MAINASIKFWLVTFYQKGFFQMQFKCTFFQENRKVFKTGRMWAMIADFLGFFTSLLPFQLQVSYQSVQKPYQRSVFLSSLVSIYFDSPQHGHTIKTNCIKLSIRSILIFSENALGLVSPSHFVYDFSTKLAHMLRSINCLNFIVTITC